MSKIIEAWDRAEFEEIARFSLSRFKRKDVLNAIRESRYAVKLLDQLRVTERPNLDVQPSSAKVVTILHASLPHHTGGYTGRAQGLLKGMVDQGLEVRAYTRPGFYNERVDKKEKFPYPVDNVDGVEYRHLPTDVPRGRGEFEYMFKSIPWYREVFELEQPNVVHVRSTYLIALPALIAAHQIGIPVVYEVSGLWELVYEGRGELGRANRITRMEDAVCAHADRIVSMNTSMAKLLSERSANGLDIGLVPNAVDVNKFNTLTAITEVSKFTYDAGYVGSLVDYEGLDLLVRAVALSRDEGRDIRVKIVGKGAELKNLRKLVKELGVEHLVNLTGPVSADEAKRQFENVNVIVLPRKRTPATEIVTPLKPFEAMAAGRPLLVSDVSALKEVSRNESIATTFTSGDAVSLKESLIRLLDSKVDQQQLVAEALKAVTVEHNWEVVGNRMCEVLTDTAIKRPNLPFITRSKKITHTSRFVFGN